MDKKQILTIVLGSCIGAVLSGFSSAYLYYHYSYKYFGGGLLGADFHAYFYALVGLGFGIIGGAVAGGLITGFRFGKIVSLLIGIIANVIFPLLRLWTEGISMEPSIIRTFHSSLLWQVLTGAIVGLALSLLSDYFSGHNQENSMNQFS